MKNLFFRKLEYWQQLIIVFAIGITILAFSSSFILTYTASRNVTSQLTEQSMFLAESIARQSRLSLLYQSRDEAANVGTIAMEFPDVVGIEIRTESNVVLHSAGRVPASAPGMSTRRTTLLEDSEDQLVFLAPVLTQVEQDDVLEADSLTLEEPQLVGYITLVVSKSSLNKIWGQLLQSNVLVSLLEAAFLLFILLLLTRRLTDPLRQLAQVMRRAKNGELNLRASLDGPRDIENMQSAFNTMMAALESRTKELSLARDQALESAKVKSEFAANVSHELRTPMNAVLGMLDLLSVMELSSQQLEYVETAKLSAQNLLALIDDILSYVHSDSGRLVLDRAPCDVNNLLEEVVALLASQAMRKELNFGYVVEPNIGLFQTDVQRVRQVLINLIGNAIKFTDVGEVSVTAYRKRANPERIVFSIEDTGIGISESAQAKIFDAFTQEDSSTTRKHGGTGLGLAISKQFARLLSGELRCQSTKGSGSIFELELPYEPASDTAEPQATAPVPNALVFSSSTVVQGFLLSWFNARSGTVRSCSSMSDVLDVLNLPDTSAVKYDYLFLDEDVTGIGVSDLPSLISDHSAFHGCQIVLLVNPWSPPTFAISDQVVIMEKPLLSSKVFRLLEVPHNQESGDSAPPHRRSAVAKTSLQGLRVLVADDNRSNCLVATGMLDKLGCDYAVANNGKEALDKVLGDHFDVILMDCNMPLMDGFDATRMIRRLQNDTGRLVIIAMTANSTEEEQQRCLASGMDGFMPKPLSIELLSNVLQSFCLPSGGSDLQVEDLESVPLDKVRLEKLRQSVGDVFPLVITALLEDIPVYLDQLNNALQKKDNRQAFEIAHTIKGCATNVGALEVAGIAKDLEGKGKSSDIPGCEKLYRSLRTACSELLETLGQYLDDDNAQAQNQDISLNRETILVADDDRSMRLALGKCLAQEGYKVVEASNGRSALAICQRTMPDLVLVDAIMPELDGFATCKQIRELTGGIDVPILMLTALEDDESISRAFKAGATDYITKPANYSVLRQRVSRVLQTSHVERHVRKLAYQDTLTGLPNRAHFNQQLRHKISRANLHGKKLAVLFLDFNRFKLINDSLGHDMGDLLLKAAADRISHCVRSDDLVARLGGDEFTIVLEDIGSVEIVREISAKIVAELNRPFVFENQRLYISASIGISIYPDDGISYGELVRHADNAMYKAKEIGAPYHFFTSGMADEVLKRMEFERDIRLGIENDQFVLHYQPQVDLSTGSVRGVEALVRWNHPVKGLLSAADFISHVEDAGLIGSLGTLVFYKACQQLELWCQQGYEVRLAVNVSGGEFQDGQLSHQVFRLMEQFNFPPHCLEIEITESMLMENRDQVRSELVSLREKGISIAIDDFGSGFSSLNYLKNFSVDLLKIDREFVKDCHTNKNDEAIITGIVALADSLGMKVVAEGVELAEQMALLKRTGCAYAQGYLLGRPKPAEEVPMATGRHL